MPEFRALPQQNLQSIRLYPVIIERFQMRAAIVRLAGQGVQPASGWRSTQWPDRARVAWRRCRDGDALEVVAVVGGWLSHRSRSVAISADEGCARCVSPWNPYLSAWWWVPASYKSFGRNPPTRSIASGPGRTYAAAVAIRRTNYRPERWRPNLSRFTLRPIASLLPNTAGCRLRHTTTQCLRCVWRAGCLDRHTTGGQAPRAGRSGYAVSSAKRSSRRGAGQGGF